MILSPGRTLEVPVDELGLRRPPTATRENDGTTLEGVERAHILRALEEANWCSAVPKAPRRVSASSARRCSTACSDSGSHRALAERAEIRHLPDPGHAFGTGELPRFAFVAFAPPLRSAHALRRLPGMLRITTRQEDATAVLRPEGRLRPSTTWRPVRESSRCRSSSPESSLHERKAAAATSPSSASNSTSWASGPRPSSSSTTSACAVGRFPRTRTPASRPSRTSSRTRSPASRSRSSLGDDAVVGPGGIVWTQAGSGVIHGTCDEASRPACCALAGASACSCP